MTSFCLEHFPDDPSIPDEAELFRRIPPRHIIQDHNLGRFRPSSAAFEDDGDGDPMSVYLATFLEVNHRDASSVLIGHPGYALASITAGAARTLRQTVHHDPLPEEFSHAVVCGDKRSGGNNSAKKIFAKSAEWVIAPAGATAPNQPM
jgi:hypothetical protein